MRMTSRASVALLLCVLPFTSCRQVDGPPPEHDPREFRPTPADLMAGQQLYEENCSRCHGHYGGGTGLGPPLVHRVYEPSHHGDVAFHYAVRSGVIAHHWRFGNMPPLPQVSTEQVDEIVGYVRWMQREAGIQ